MPNAQVHDKLAGITAAVSIPVTYYIAQTETIPFPIYDSIFYAAMFLICNHWLSPDLDVISAPFYRWGKLRWIWFPYQKLIKHRSWLSHSGPISFTIRIVYLFFPLLIYWCLFPPSETVLYYVVLFWIAGSLADLLHTLADWVTSFW